MNRRGFLSSIILAAAAPAIVRAGSLMRVVPRDTAILQLAPIDSPLQYTLSWHQKAVGAFGWERKSVGVFAASDKDAVAIVQNIDIPNVAVFNVQLERAPYYTAPLLTTMIPEKKGIN